MLGTTEKTGGDGKVWVKEVGMYGCVFSKIEFCTLKLRFSYCMNNTLSPVNLKLPPFPPLHYHRPVDVHVGRNVLWSGFIFYKMK